MDVVSSSLRRVHRMAQKALSLVPGLHFVGAAGYAIKP
jgi:hypothetical protein